MKPSAACRRRHDCRNRKAVSIFRKYFYLLFLLFFFCSKPNRARGTHVGFVAGKRDCAFLELTAGGLDYVG